MATIPGTSGADQLGATGMTLTADRISAGAGTDTLIYDLATAGGADTYYGGTGVDTLELNLTAAEWVTHRVKVLALQKAVNDAAKPSAGAVAGGTNFGKLDFGNGKSLQVYEVEAVKIFIDGNLYTGDVPVNKPVSLTSAAQAGGVTEDGTLTASGAVEFVDADLADAHQASFVAAAGQTALGTFELDTVNEDSETNDGMVGWVYNLDNSSAAVQALAAGQVVTEKYTVSVTDGKGSTVQQVVTITITGMADAPPIVTTTEGAVVEAGTGIAGTPEAGGKMPLDGVSPTAVWEVYIDPAEEGVDATEFGTFTITPNGQWKFKLDQAKADKLDQDEVRELTFSVTATEDGASVLRTVTITLTGSADAISIAADAGADKVVVEAGGVDNETNDDGGASGKLTITDPDGSGAAFVADTISGTYGDLNIDASGNWGYSLRNGEEAVQKLRPGQTVTETITVKATDAAESTYKLQITITGAEDAATMAIVKTLVPKVDADGFLLDADGNATDKQVTVAEVQYDNLVHEAPGKNYAGVTDSTTSGKLSLTDPDGGDLSFHQLDAAEREDGEFAGSVSAGQFGNFQLNASTGEWTYTLDNTLEATQKLNADSVLEDTFDSVVVYSADGKSSQAITVFVKGAEDGFSKIVADADADGSKGYKGFVLEETPELDADGVPVKNDDGTIKMIDDIGANGKLIALDPDGNAADPDGDTGVGGIKDGVFVGKYGELTIDADGVWSYAANTTDATVDGKKSIQTLGKDQVVTESFLIRSIDDQASFAINVRLTGANDAAVLTDVTKDAEGNAAAADVTVTEAGGTNNNEVGDKAAKGTVKFVDIDEGQSSFAAGTPTTFKGSYGTFKLNTATGDWSYELDNSKVNHLRANEVVQDSWTLTSADKSTGKITVDVIGADDASVISVVAGGDYIAKEAGGTNNAVKGDALASGALTITDPDGALEDNEGSFSNLFSVAGGEGNFDAKGVAKAVDEAALTFSEPAEAVGGKIWGQYGFFTFNGETNKWNYTLVEKATDDAASADVALRTTSLSGGENAMDVLRVYSSNLAGFVDLKVKITGSNDSAVVLNDLAGESLSLQADGFMKDASGAVVAVDNADGETSGTLSLVDPDGGTAGTLAGFSSKAIAGALSGTATVFKGTYGTFEIELPAAGDAPAETAAWKYTLNEFDKDTRALVYGAKAVDKVNVTATDGSVYTISVNVTGANNAPEFMRAMDAVTGLPTETSIAPKVNKDGTITYQVIDGDTGGKLTLQVKDGELVRDVTALTVVDGGVSTVKLATANSTVLYTGIMQVTDKTHAALDLGTYLGMGTKGNDEFNSGSDAGSLISGMDGNDTVNVTGNGAAYISGGAGNDSVTSAGGNDTILGGVGNDVIVAGDGDDRIQGDAGSDVLSGEGGNDTFVFLTSTEFTAASALPTAAKADVVMDFDAGDKILLSKALLPTAFFTYKDVYLADGTTLGKDGTLDLVAAKAFKDNGTGDQVRLNDLIDGEWFRSDVEISETTGKVTAGTLYAEDRVIYDGNTGVLWYDADGNGTKAAVKIADLDNGYALTANDIQFG